MWEAWNHHRQIQIDQPVYWSSGKVIQTLTYLTVHIFKPRLIKCTVWKLSPHILLPSLKIYSDDIIQRGLKLLKNTNLKLQIYNYKHRSINLALLYRPREDLSFMCLFFSPPPTTARLAEIHLLSFSFLLFFRGLQGSLFCVSVQAITLQFEFILAIKRNSNLYAPLPHAPLRHGQLSSQQFKERAVMSTSVQGVRRKHTQHTVMFFLLWLVEVMSKWHYSKLPAQRDSLCRHCTPPSVDFSFLSFILQ